MSSSFQESAFETHAWGRLCVWVCRRVQACARESAAPAPTGWPVRGREGQSRRSDVPYKTGTGCGGHFERQLSFGLHGDFRIRYAFRALMVTPWEPCTRFTPHSQPTAYRAHATQPTVPSAKRSQSAPGVCRRSARVGGSGAALWAAHPHTRLGRAGRARGVSRARRTRGSRRGSPQPGSRAAAPAGAQPPPPPRAAAGCCPAHAKKSA